MTNHDTNEEPRPTASTAGDTAAEHLAAKPELGTAIGAILVVEESVNTKPVRLDDSAVVTTLVPVGSIRTDGGTQPRADIDRATVAEYVADLNASAVFPAVVVFHDGAVYWLADGFHRFFAHREAGCDAIRAIVHQGTQTEAQWFSYAANRKQDCVGLRRKNADKERAVRAALRHPNGARMSDGAIAEHVGVADRTVAKYRATVTTKTSESAKRTGRDGRSITVTNIGKGTAKAEAKPTATLAPFSSPATGGAMNVPAPSVTSESASMADEAAVVDPAVIPCPLARVTDELGHAIESDEIAAVFANRQDFKSLMREVSALKKKFQELTALPGGEWAARHQQQFEADVSNLHAALRFSIPYALCPYCGGDKCSRCKNTGWMPEEVFKNVPSDVRGRE